MPVAPLPAAADAAVEAGRLPAAVTPSVSKARSSPPSGANVGALSPPRATTGSPCWPLEEAEKKGGGGGGRGRGGRAQPRGIAIHKKIHNKEADGRSLPTQRCLDPRQSSDPRLPPDMHFKTNSSAPVAATARGWGTAVVVVIAVSMCWRIRVTNTVVTATSALPGMIPNMRTADPLETSVMMTTTATQLAPSTSGWECAPGGFPIRSADSRCLFVQSMIHVHPYSR